MFILNSKPFVRDNFYISFVLIKIAKLFKTCHLNAAFLIDNTQFCVENYFKDWLHKLYTYCAT